MEKKKKFVGYVYSDTCREMNSKYYGCTYIYTSHERDSTKPLREEIIKKFGVDAFIGSTEMRIECDTEEELREKLDWHKTRLIKFYNGQPLNLPNGIREMETNYRVFKEAWNYVRNADEAFGDIAEEPLDEDGKAIVKELHALRLKMGMYVIKKRAIV